MNIEINKDFLKEYKDDAWKGFSLRELLSLIGAGLIGIGVDALLHFYAGISIATGVYFALPLAFPVILIGFYRYQGFLTIGRFLKEFLYGQRTATVLYDSAEVSFAEKQANLFPDEGRGNGRRSGKKTGNHMGKHAGKYTGKYAGQYVGKQMEKPAGKCADRHTGRNISENTDKRGDQEWEY